MFKAISAQKCYYPFSIPFLRKKEYKLSSKYLVFLILVFALLSSCTSKKEISQFDRFLEYEGRYQYFDNTTLDIVASKLDTTLYAVIDQAKYPLRYIDLDSFVDAQKSPVVFQRDANKNIVGYEVSGETFQLITKDFEKLQMLPREKLFDNPEGYSYIPPKNKDDGLQVGNLFEEFENPDAIVQMIKETIGGSYPDVHSILIYKNDRLVLEEYFYGYDQSTPHQLRSATKPIISGILGIAIDKGFIKSEKEKLLPFFDATYSEISNLNASKKEITIENFLMYRHGLDCENNNPESKGNEASMMKSNDWVKYTLDLPMATQPGKVSSYCTGCALTIGSLVEKATGENIEDFAKKNLFSLLGISNYDWTFEPNSTSFTTFSQLSIRPRDLMKLAKMYKDNGKWNGRQILSEEWVNKTFHMEDGDYGYLWKHKYFLVEGKRFNSYMATGNGGQKINIWPELDMITVFNGGNYNSYQLYGKATPPNEMIPRFILKAL